MITRSKKIVLGLDFGTDSVRAVLIHVETGKELACAKKDYKRWKLGLYCDPVKSLFRQHPLDYLEAMEDVVHAALEMFPDAKHKIVALSIAVTGSTPVAVDAQGTPLAMHSQFSEYPNAMFVLWKDHSGQKECERINSFSKQWETDYTRSDLCGSYSVEHFWTKALHIFKDSKIKAVAHSFVEASDWLPGELTGCTQPDKIKRGMGIASSRVMWNRKWGGYPPNNFFKAVDPVLDGLVDTFDPQAYTCDQLVGSLTKKWSEKLGLDSDVLVSVGNLDCHAGAIGAGVKAHSMVEIMGTSTVAITIAPSTKNEKEVVGVPQQAEDMILPRFIGYEGGQSCFGDLYAWFQKILFWPFENMVKHSSTLDGKTKEKLMEEVHQDMIPTLNDYAEKVLPEDNAVIATDWINGRRSPNANFNLKGTITGLTLAGSAPHIHKSLIEATAFGAKAFIEQFQRSGGGLNEVIAVGGISQKSSYIMQVLADVIGMPIRVVDAQEACALGAGMCATVAAQIYDNMEQAQKSMEMGVSKVYKPNSDLHDYYKHKYKSYLGLENIEKTFLTEEKF